MVFYGGRGETAFRINGLRPPYNSSRRGSGGGVMGCPPSHGHAAAASRTGPIGRDRPFWASSHVRQRGTAWPWTGGDYLHKNNDPPRRPSDTAKILTTSSWPRPRRRLDPTSYAPHLYRRWVGKGTGGEGRLCDRGRQLKTKKI